MSGPVLLRCAAPKPRPKTTRAKNPCRRCHTFTEKRLPLSPCFQDNQRPRTRGFAGAYGGRPQSVGATGYGRGATANLSGGQSLAYIINRPAPIPLSCFLGDDEVAEIGSLLRGAFRPEDK